jgi:hypothetical protein
MSRLIVFGCSLAYGVGLPDCWPNLSKPSKLSWTNIVAQNFGRKLVNKSRPGSANKSIWFTINKFKFKPDDVVVISWSYPERHSIIKSSLTNCPLSIKNLQIRNIDHDESSKSYYTDIYGNYDSIVMSKLYIDHANRILLDKGLTVYNLVIERKHSLLIGDHNFIPLYMGEYERVYPTALDGDHLGLEGQQVFASDLIKFLNGNHSQMNASKIFFKSLKNMLWK